jgi:hypothetical protein
LLPELHAIVVGTIAIGNPTLKLIRLVKQLRLVRTFSHEVVAHGILFKSSVNDSIVTSKS